MNMTNIESVGQSYWLKAIAEQENIRCVWIDATNLVNELIQIHGLRDLPAQALGEATLGALMIASYCKPGERVNLQIQGSGACRQAFVDADPDGKVRGYVIQNTDKVTSTSTPSTQSNTPQEDVGIWGHGIISVLRTKAEAGSPPYTGAVPLATGDLQHDLRSYWNSSEQVATSLALEVRTQGATCLQAYGILVQILGGAKEEEKNLVKSCQSKIEMALQKISSQSDPLLEINGCLHESALLFQPLDSQPLSFFCSCSIDRVKRALLLIGATELESIIKEEGKATMSCDFCEKQYHLNTSDLEDLIEQLRMNAPGSNLIH